MNCETEFLLDASKIINDELMDEQDYEASWVEVFAPSVLWLIPVSSQELRLSGLNGGVEITRMLVVDTLRFVMRQTRQ